MILLLWKRSSRRLRKNRGTERHRTAPDQPSGNGKALVVYFSAQGNTQAVAERIVELTGADVYRIEAAEPYAANPYDDSDRIQNEVYNDLRPAWPICPMRKR